MLTVTLAGLTGCGEAEPEVVVDAPDELGPHGVGHESFTAIDAARDDRSLLIDVWYPIDADSAEALDFTSYPLTPLIGLESEVARDGAEVAAVDPVLVVFSHGYTGINLQSIPLMEALASHGFIVAAPEHTGNAQASPDDDFDTAAANRVPDVGFVIDTMTARAADGEDVFYGALTQGIVGVIGHSFGGMTAIGVKAGWAGAEADPRVAAIVPISAVIDGELQASERLSANAGFAAEQLARIEVPVMLVGGTEDTTVPIENNAIAFEQIVNAPAIYKADIIGANHTHFAGVCDIGDLLIEIGWDQEDWPILGAADLIEPYAATCSEEAFPIEEATRLLNLYAVAFFRRHLTGELGYGEYLTATHAQTEAAAELETRP